MSGQIEVTAALTDYLCSVSLREEPVLAELRAETARLGGAARMQISAHQGQFMRLLAELVGVRPVLDAEAVALLDKELKLGAQWAETLMDPSSSDFCTRDLNRCRKLRLGAGVPAAVRGRLGCADLARFYDFPNGE
jgi:hypothetical protein